MYLFNTKQTRPVSLICI